jgi:threonine/homoserine/homoserine lactone efflux protein
MGRAAGRARAPAGGQGQGVTALLVGFGLGFFVGAQPGPVSLLCVRSVLRGAFTSGIAIGAGAAVVDLLYAALGLAGAASLLEIDALRIGLGVFGALVLAVIGTRTLWAAFRVRLGAETPDEVATPRRAFATAVAATASNPLTIATWAAIFAAASTASDGAAGSSAAGAALLLGGVGLGTLTAFSALTALVTLVRSRLGPRLLATVDLVAGAGLLGFAGLVGWRTVHDS